MIKFKKTISALILSGLLLSFVAYYNTPSAYAVPTVDPGSAATAVATWAQFAQYTLKEFVVDLAARLIARLQLTSALNGIAGQILQSGRTGRAPAFVQNWRNFITDAEYRGEDVFRSILANTANCPHIKRDLLNMFGVRTPSALTQNIRTGNLDSYVVRGKCTLPPGWTIQNYNNDFAGNGGWEALTRLASPENNFYGATIMAMGELNAQRNLDRTADRSETAGTGFTGTRRSSITSNSSCDTPPTTGGQCITDPFGEGIAGRFCNNTGQACSSNNDCQQFNFSQARCTFLGQVTTPSKILGDAGSQFVDSNLKWLTTSDELSEVLGNFIGTMIGKLVNFTADAIAPGNVAEPQHAEYRACVARCNNTVTGSQNASCIDQCYKNAGVGTPRDYGQFGTSPTPTPGSGGGVCSDTGTTTPRYASAVRSAIDWVRANNPGGIMQMNANSTEGRFAYGQHIVERLRSSAGGNYQATNDILNGNGNPSTGDIIAVWVIGNTSADRYDIIGGFDEGEVVPISDPRADYLEFAGQIPISSCVPGDGSSGGNNGGGGGTCSDGIQNQDETGIDTGGVCDSGPGPGGFCGDGFCQRGSGEDETFCPEDCQGPLPA